MQIASIFSVLAISLSVAACVSQSETPSYYQNLEGYDAQINQQVVAQMISSYRANNGLSPVAIDPVLTGVARKQSQAMANAEDVEAANKPAVALKTQMQTAGQGDVYARNNVSAGYRRWAEAFSGWRDSKKHNAVMLDPNVTRIGIATSYAPRSKYKVFWSLVAAGPKL